MMSCYNLNIKPAPHGLQTVINKRLTEMPSGWGVKYLGSSICFCGISAVTIYFKLKNLRCIYEPTIYKKFLFTNKLDSRHLDSVTV